MEAIFFNQELKKNNCNILLSLNGIYHGSFEPTLLMQQNILPFEEYAKKKYSLIYNLKFFLQKISIIFSIKFHKNVIFTSFDLKEKILNNFRFKKIQISKVIYHGVKKANQTKLRKILSNRKKIRFLYISEFQKYKNHENLLRHLNC